MCAKGAGAVARLVCVNPEAFMREVLLEFLSGVALLLTHSDGKLKCFQRGGVDGTKGL